MPVARLEDLEFGNSGKATLELKVLVVYGSLIMCLLGKDRPAIILGEAIVRIGEEQDPILFDPLPRNLSILLSLKKFYATGSFM